VRVELDAAAFRKQLEQRLHLQPAGAIEVLEALVQDDGLVNGRITARHRIPERDELKVPRRSPRRAVVRQLGRAAVE
jgi:hypothetical protein